MRRIFSYMYDCMTSVIVILSSILMLRSISRWSVSAVLSDDDKTLITTLSQRFVSQANQISNQTKRQEYLNATISRLTILLQHPRIRSHARLKTIIESIISSLSVVPIYDQFISGSIIQQILILTNTERNKRWLSWLNIDNRLSLAAQRHAEYMANTQDFAHKTNQWSEPSDRAEAAWYPWILIAENIGRCSDILAPCNTTSSMMKQWMSSSWHAANILDPDLKELGLGYQDGYRVQMFWSR